MTRVLVVEDEPDLADPLGRYATERASGSSRL